MSNSTGVLTLILILVLYFLPWFIAAARGHHQRTAIAVLNLLLGWTVLGWVAAIVWACTQVRISSYPVQS